MKKILLVEDELAMRKGLVDNLEIEGYEVDEAENGKIGLNKILENTYNLILLDVMMPEISGFDVCKKVRASGNQTPIIMLTAKGEEIDKVLGLEFGADDYITKPFSLRELLARVKAILRRTESEPTTIEEYTLGKMKINFSKYLAIVDDKEENLSHREFEVLQYFVNHKNEIVSRDDLLREVWGHQSRITTRTVDNFILKLRQKIEMDINHPKVFLTIYGVGYKLVL